MGFIEKRKGKYRARYRDPLGDQRCKTFIRKPDAERYLREVQVEMDRGRWLDPSGADMPLATWAEEFLSLARRLSPLTQEGLPPRHRQVPPAPLRRIPHRPPARR